MNCKTFSTEREVNDKDLILSFKLKNFIFIFINEKNLNKGVMNIFKSIKIKQINRK